MVNISVSLPLDIYDLLDKQQKSKHIQLLLAYALKEWTDCPMMTEAHKEVIKPDFVPANVITDRMANMDVKGLTEHFCSKGMLLIDAINKATKVHKAYHPEAYND